MPTNKSKLKPKTHVVIVFEPQSAFRDLARFIQPFFLLSPELEEEDNKGAYCTWLLSESMRDTLLQTKLPSQLKEFVGFFSVFFIDYGNGDVLDWDGLVDLQAATASDASTKRALRAVGATRVAARAAHATELGVIEAALAAFEPTFVAFRNAGASPPPKYWLSRCAQLIGEAEAAEKKAGAKPAPLVLYAPGFLVLLHYAKHVEACGGHLLPPSVTPADAYYYALLRALESRTQTFEGGGGQETEDADKVLLAVDDDAMIMDLAKRFDEIGAPKKKKVHLKFTF